MNQPARLRLLNASEIVAKRFSNLKQSRSHATKYVSHQKCNAETSLNRAHVVTHPRVHLAWHLTCQLLILLNRLALSNTIPIVMLNFQGCNILLLQHWRHALGNPTPLAPLPLHGSVFKLFLMAKPHSVKASPHWLCAFNNEVLAGTVGPLCRTRADPWGDFLVVMLPMQQSLPQRPGSAELHYKTQIVSVA